MLMQSLCAQLEPDWTFPNAFSAVNMLQALAKCHLQREFIPQQHLDSAVGQVLAFCPQLDQQGVSLTTWSCASLYQRHNPTKYYPLLDQLSEAALKLPVQKTRLQHVATVVWSMARSQYLPSEELLLKMTEAACACVTHSSQPQPARDLEMLFLGYAWLGYPPAPQAMQKLVNHFLEQRLLGHQASNMAWSLAVLGGLEMPIFWSLMTHISEYHMEDIKINRQLHFAAEFLRPPTSSAALFDEWHQLTDRLHQSWPDQPYDPRTRRIHAEVLTVLREGLGLKCRQDVPLAREHNHSLFSLDILIEEQPGIPCPIAVEVDGPDCYIHNEPSNTWSVTLHILHLLTSSCA